MNLHLLLLFPLQSPTDIQTLPRIHTPPLLILPILPILLLRRKTRLRNLMRLAQLVLADRQTSEQAHEGDDGVEDPQLLQTLRVDGDGDRSLGRGQGGDDSGVGAGGPAAELGGGCGGQGGKQLGEALLHAILEDDAADDHGDGGREVAGEAEGGGGGGNVARRDERLESDERRLEVRTGADTGEDLEHDEPGPGRFGGEIDVEAEAEGQEDHSEPDGIQIVSGLADDDTDCGGDEGEGEDEREKVDARKERTGAQDGLEVERQEIGARDEDEAVAEAGDKSGDVGTSLEQAERNDRVFGDLPFDDEEEPDGDDSKHDETDDLC